MLLLMHKSPCLQINLSIHGQKTQHTKPHLSLVNSKWLKQGGTEELVESCKQIQFLASFNFSTFSIR